MKLGQNSRVRWPSLNPPQQPQPLEPLDPLDPPATPPQVRYFVGLVCQVVDWKGHHVAIVRDERSPPRWKPAVVTAANLEVIP